MLSFVPLWSAAGTLETGLLALLLPRIATEKTFGLELRPQFRIVEEKRTADAMTHGIGLGALAASLHKNFHIECLLDTAERERGNGILATYSREIFFQLLIIHDDIPRALLIYFHARDGVFSLPDAIEVLPFLWRISHKKLQGNTQRLLRIMRMLRLRKNMEFLEKKITQAIFGKHSLDGIANNATRILLEESSEG